MSIGKAFLFSFIMMVNVPLVLVFLYQHKKMNVMCLITFKLAAPLQISTLYTDLKYGTRLVLHCFYLGLLLLCSHVRWQFLSAGWIIPLTHCSSLAFLPLSSSYATTHKACSDQHASPSHRQRQERDFYLRPPEKWTRFKRRTLGPELLVLCAWRLRAPDEAAHWSQQHSRPDSR